MEPKLAKVPRIFGKALDLKFWGPLEAKSFGRGPKIHSRGVQARVFDLKCRSCLKESPIGILKSRRVDFGDKFNQNVVKLN